MMAYWLLGIPCAYYSMAYWRINEFTVQIIIPLLIGILCARIDQLIRTCLIPNCTWDTTPIGRISGSLDMGWGDSP